MSSQRSPWQICSGPRGLQPRCCAGIPCNADSMTHRLTLPYSLDDGAMSILGEHFLADGRMDDGGRFIASPLHSGGESDKSFAGKAPALSLAVRAPAGWQRP